MPTLVAVMQAKLDLKKDVLVNQIKNIPNNKIISIDEVSFDTNIIHNYGWSKKNIPIIKTIGATYKRLTMICAISNKKIVHYKIIKNSANSVIFLDFIKSIPNIKNKYLFLDNARIHHSKIISSHVKENNIKLLFNVPYSPEYNPIEIMFSKLKKLVKDYKLNNKLDTLTTNIVNSMKYITSSNLTNFFNYSFSKLRDT
jgi:transposase